MKKITLSILLLLIIKTLSAQKTIEANPYAPIDKLALQLPDSLAKTTAGIANYVNANFNNNKDKVPCNLYMDKQ